MAKFVDNRRGRVQQDQTPINESITAKTVRLIGAQGEAVGVVSIDEALQHAAAAALDLVMVSEEVEPPVCKILDYGKHKYELQKKKAESRKKQKAVVVKEVQIRPFIGENDLLVKCRAVKRFLEAGDKVKLLLRFRGRELSHQELGFNVVKKVLEFCGDLAKEESASKLEGSTIMTVLTKR